MKLHNLASGLLKGRSISLPQGGRIVLAVGSVDGRWPGKTLCRGWVTVYYGLPLLNESDYLVPVLGRDDFRREYHAMEALRFTVEQGAAYPRGDIAGMRISTGMMETLLLKQIDLGGRVAAFFGGMQIGDSSICQIDAVVWAGKVDDGWERVDKSDQRFPDPLPQYVPCFAMDSARMRDLPALLELALA